MEKGVGKKIIALLTVAAMTVMLAGCSGQGGDKPIIIRMTHTQQPESISDLTAREFKRLVEEKSGGSMV